jgi:ABC-type multidrug transport system ATPase subunit
VVLDEPENHLHPTMQRSILSNLIESFPNAQFVVATHSPFIVSSVKDSYVYVLRYNVASEVPASEIKNSVQSLRLDNANKAGTASEILRDVLGVPVTLPEWAEEEVKKIAAEFDINALNMDTLSDLRSQLDAAGLGEFYPDALKQIVRDHD